MTPDTRVTWAAPVQLAVSHRDFPLAGNQSQAMAPPSVLGIERVRLGGLNLHQELVGNCM